MSVSAMDRTGRRPRQKVLASAHCLEEPSGFLDPRVSQSGREPGSTSTGTDPRAAVSQPAEAPPMAGGGNLLTAQRPARADNRRMLHRLRRYDESQPRDMRRAMVAGNAPTASQVQVAQ